MERSVEQRILVTLRKLLAQIVRETTPQPGMKSPLSPQTLKDIRTAFELIAIREQELLKDAGGASKERPRYPDEPKTTHSVRITPPRRHLDS